MYIQNRSYVTSFFLWLLYVLRKMFVFCCLFCVCGLFCFSYGPVSMGKQIVFTSDILLVLGYHLDEKVLNLGSLQDQDLKWKQLRKI